MSSEAFGRPTSTDGLAQEFERVAERVWELTGLSQQLTRAIQLSRNQEKAVAARTTGGRSEISRADYDELAEVKRTQASADLTNLVRSESSGRWAVGGVRATAWRSPRTRRVGASGGLRRDGPRSASKKNSATSSVSAANGRRLMSFATREGCLLYQAASRQGGIARRITLLRLDAPQP